MVKAWLRDAYRTPVTLRSPLKPAECLRRVKAATVTPYSFQMRTAAARFKGSAQDYGISLRWNINYRNDFQRALNLQLVPDGEGTVLRGAFVVSPFVVVSVLLFCGVTGTVGFSLLAAAWNGSLNSGGTPVGSFTLVPLGMMLFVVALLAFGLRLSRGPESKALDLLTTMLECSPVAPDRSRNL